MFPNKILIFFFLGKSILYSLVQTVSVDFTESQDHRMVEVNLTWLTWHIHFFIKAKASRECFPFPTFTEKFFFRKKPE